MKEELATLIERLEREYLATHPEVRAVAPRDWPTIHYSELPEDTSDRSTAKEWNFYRREVGRLLADGHEGKTC